jgi:staphylococcal nuclease domain-containing protein 1
MSSTDGGPRDIGTASIGGLDVASELLRNGFAKTKEIKRDPNEDDLRRRELEAEAKAGSLGMWNPQGPKARSHFCVILCL